MNIQPTYQAQPVTLTGAYRITEAAGLLVEVVAAQPIFTLIGSKYPYPRLRVCDGFVPLRALRFGMAVDWPLVARVEVA